MSGPADRDVYLSLFMFTVDLQPGNAAYTKVIARHMKRLIELLRARSRSPQATNDHESELRRYVEFKRALDEEGWSRSFTTK